MLNIELRVCRFFPVAEKTDEKKLDKSNSFQSISDLPARPLNEFYFAKLFI
jgi:hypothetical protein